MEIEVRGGERDSRREDAHVNVVERQGVPMLARREIRRLVVIEERLPPVREVTAREIGREGVVRVVTHEPGEVTVVPARRGLVQHRGDVGGRVAAGPGWGARGGDQEGAREESHR